MSRTSRDVSAVISRLRHVTFVRRTTPPLLHTRIRGQRLRKRFLRPERRLPPAAGLPPPIGNGVRFTKPYRNRSPAPRLSLPIAVALPLRSDHWTIFKTGCPRTSWLRFSKTLPMQPARLH